MSHSPGATTSAPPTASTLGELRASGHRPRSVRVELRDNLLAALSAGRDPWPGLHGFASSVLPQLERALLAGHDIVLLGERGQGKTRLLRSLVGLLDEWSPVIDGSELGEDPLEPITVESRRRAAELGVDPEAVTGSGPDGLVRVSVGLEHIEDIIEDREQAFKKIR